MNTLPRRSERGSARLKFIIVLAIIAIVAYCGYQFIPVAYQAYQFRDLMQHDVDTAVALGRPTSWIKDQLTKSAAEYGIPADAVITPTQEDNRMEVRVQYAQPIEFPGFVYNYEFDHTVKSATFLSIK
jgi:hypothetical protein